MTLVPWSNNTGFPNASTSAAITLVGLQSGGNVKVPANALAYAIQQALQGYAFNIKSLGTLAAANLSGTNTGDQIAATVLYTPGSVPGVSNVQAALDYLATHSSSSPTGWPADLRKAPQKVAVSPGTYGDSTHLVQLKVDKFGRVIYVAQIALPVVSVSVTAPITNSGSSSAPNIGISAASASAAGSMAANDFSALQSLIHAACGGM